MIGFALLLSLIGNTVFFMIIWELTIEKCGLKRKISDLKDNLKDARKNDHRDALGQFTKGED